jgi:ornithine cyclodeaminase/alanine dehydrogenase-like protein (mu-crystallin family)
MIVLNNNETLRIVENLNMESIINEVENAYIRLSEGSVVMPDRAFMPTHSGGDLLLGPSYIKSSGYYGVKLSSYSPNNVEQPKVNGTYTLFNEIDGTIAAIMDAGPLTAARTGAKSAVAVKYLAPQNANTLGIFGMGAQAKTQITAINTINPLKKVLLWSREPSKHNDLLKYVTEVLNIDAEVTDPIYIAQHSDILIDATYTTQPLVSNQNIKENCLVIGINHSPSAVEFDESTLGRAEVYVDYLQNTHSGTIQNAIENGKTTIDEITELKDIVNRPKKELNTSTFKNIIYFQSGGTSIEDLAAAIAVYKKACQQPN